MKAMSDAHSQTSKSSRNHRYNEFIYYREAARLFDVQLFLFLAAAVGKVAYQ